MRPRLLHDAPCNRERIHAASHALCEEASLVEVHRGGRLICKEKIRYATMVEAEQARRAFMATAGKDKRHRRLVCYPCRDCQFYHLGHVRRNMNEPAKKIKIPKPPTPGELRRRAKHEAKAAERSANRKARHVFAQIGFLVDVETAARRAKYAVDDLADSMQQARKMAERITFVK